MRYSADTNIISALVRDPRGVVTKRIRDVGEANVCTSIIVESDRPRLRQYIDDSYPITAELEASHRRLDSSR